MKKKLIAALLSLCMAAGMLTACSGTPSPSNSSAPASAPSEGGASSETESDSNVTAVGEYPIVKESITFKVMGRKDAGAPDWSELEVFKRLTELTNINFEFEISEPDTFKEQKNIALVGGEYGDLILRDDINATTDEETYGPQGIFLELTDLINNYMPNLKALLDSKPDVKASITSMDGKIYGLPYVFETATTQGHIGFLDQEWLDNVGVTKVPETTDELYEVLKLFKEKDANGNGDPNDEIPFTAFGLTSTIRDLMIPAFTGVPDGLSFNVKDGEVIYAPAMAEYKDFLAYMSKLYAEGLLDPEFSTQTSQQWLAKVKGNLCGIYSASPTNRDPETTTTQQLSLPPLTSPTNDQKVVKKPISIYPGRAFITDKCSDPVAAARLLDLFYATPENAVEGFCGNTCFLGWENEHWKYTDDTKTAYEWIAPVTGFSDVNKTISVNMELPGYLYFMAAPTGNPLMEMKVAQVKKMQMPYYTNPFPTNARFTAEESERGNVIENDLYNYVVMMTTKFITGEESIDKFDNYIDTLNQYGLPELLEIKKAALERWNEAVK